MSNNPSRRAFAKASAIGACCYLAKGAAPLVGAQGAASKPALLGGTPVRSQPFASWPMITESDDRVWLDVLHQKKWCRLDGNYVNNFEKAWAQMLDAKRAVATSSGTTALLTSLMALDVGPGDEVIVPPYTFVATINVVLLRHALPVFVDTDRNTFQIDANKIEAAITPRTRCIMPVHLGGNVADMDKIMAIGAKHKIPVLEDACQAHLAEWRHKKVGTIGATGCFSFQVTKNLSSGEGGAIVGNDANLMMRCYSIQNNGRGGGGQDGSAYVRNGSNHRITEFQAALLGTQLPRLDAQAKTRTRNAEYLTAQLSKIPGLKPASMYEGCTRNAYHLYMFRYDPQAFGGLPRNRFLKALTAEGIPAAGGYVPLNKEPVIEATLNSRFYKRLFSEAELAKYRERIQCPENDTLCKEAVWFTQNMMLGTQSDMDQIVEAVNKVRHNAAALQHA